MNPYWLLHESVLDDIRAVLSSGRSPDSEVQAYEPVRPVDGVIIVEGVLTKEPNQSMRRWGIANTAYSEIIDQIERANASPKVSSITMVVNSPGGNVAGMGDAMDAIRGSTKPVTAVVKDLAASAAYSLASQASSIRASSEGSLIGSVGVVRTYWTGSYFKDVTNPESPNKRPDVTTDDGMKAAQDELSSIHMLYAKKIAQGRGVDVEKVNADFGKGGMFIASAAKEAGMIDSIGQEQMPSNTAASGQQQEVESMDLDVLKAQHPEVYAAAVQMGVKQERARCEAHIEMADASGATQVALDAIKEGTSASDDAVFGKHRVAKLQSLRADDRAGDESNMAEGADSASGDSDTSAAQKRDEHASAGLNKAFAEQFGLSVEG